LTDYEKEMAMSVRINACRFALLFIFCSAALHNLGAEEVLRNQDVIKMVSAGLSEEVIAAKVTEAPQVDFELSVDDLVALRKAGVGDRVVRSMLDRSKASASGRTTALLASPEPGYELVDVSLKTPEGVVPLRLIRGEVSSAGVGPFSNAFMNYAGLHSSVRTRDKQPVLLIKSSTAPEVGSYFYAKLDSDQRNGVRSLKISAMITRKNRPGGRLAPDRSWVIPFDVQKESPGLWRVTVKQNLEPGEYGWYVNLVEADPILHPVNPQGGCIFDFGVD
jgi:hypothetical protein